MSKADVRNTVNKTTLKASEVEGRIIEFAEDIKTLTRMLRAYVKEETFIMPKAVIVAAMAALAYFLNPIDAIPDFIIGAGFIDDAAVLTLLLTSFKQDITRFQEWEEANAGEAEEAEVIDN